MRVAANSSAARSAAGTVAIAASISASEKINCSGVRRTRSNFSPKAIKAASPSRRTCAMISATTASTSGLSSRFIPRSASNAASKSAVSVFRKIGIPVSVRIGGAYLVLAARSRRESVTGARGFFLKGPDRAWSHRAEQD